MRTETKYIIVHCSATPPEMDIGRDEIDSWHKDRGWSGIGYTEVIRRNGESEQGRDTNAIGAHVRGYNSVSVGICLVGGVNENGNPENNFTDDQFETLVRSIKFYKALFPEAMILGHRDLDENKACPSFEVSAFINERNLQ